MFSRRKDEALGIHVCHLTKQSRGSSRNTSWTSWLKGLVTISLKNPFTTLYFRSRASFKEELIRHEEQVENVLIHPFSVFAFCRMVIITLYWAIFFFVQPLMWLPWVKNQEPNYTFYVLDKLILLDMPIMFQLGYLDKNTNIVELNWKKVGKKYLRTFFLIDLVGNISDLFAWVCVPDYWLLVYILQGILRLLRVSTLIIYVKDFLMLYHQRHQALMFHMVIILIYLLQWCACVSIVTTFLVEHDANTESWLQIVGLDYESEYWKIYLQALRRSMSYFYLATVNVETEKRTEEIINTVILILGTVTFCLFITVTYKRIKEETALENEFRMISLYLVKYWRFQHALPMGMRLKLISSFERRYEKKTYEEREIWQSLSKNLRAEITLLICKPLFEDCIIFRSFPTALVISLVACLKQEYYAEGDILSMVGGDADCMFFIACGTLAAYDANGEEIYHLEDGAYFGEVTMMCRKKRTVSLVTIELAEVYQLGYKDFKRCIEPYPEAEEGMMQFINTEAKRRKLIS